ncbi:hypothetical protein HYH03_016773 [Edaphochlamys debaryana]|uniref:Uncharacterized protein n=1 Tax=Edaphochlamys debaryana TaxID=47281 RepID=A0A835XQM8_9CHLO|nr:hypothetical protein HYH03_016773 [Edaphochlamys debaryana]|eukprot:KAG2484354.1 hypothetical protein HYH03_016773 [Edaphochlamys debaryana]
MTRRRHHPAPQLLAAVPLLAAALLACLTAPAAAYPDLWLGRGGASACTAHPEGPVPGSPHGTPLEDSTIGILALAADGRDAVALCPGAAYNLQVQFPEPRRALVSASRGSLSPTAPALADTWTDCPNRLVLGPSEPYTLPSQLPNGIAARLEVPCDAAGDQGLLVQVTSVAPSRGFRWRAATRTLAVDPGCSAPQCGWGGGASPARPHAAARSGANAAAAQPPPGRVPAPATGWGLEAAAAHAGAPAPAPRVSPRPGAPRERLYGAGSGSSWTYGWRGPAAHLHT